MKVVAIIFGLLLIAGCDNDAHDRQARQMTGGDPARGKVAIEAHGCASCHTIPGVRDARSLVGPNLDRIASRNYIAGVISNTPDNMQRWLRNPPAVDPLTAMPNMYINEADARDIAGYLYTLR